MKRIVYILLIIQLCYFVEGFSQITKHGELKSNKYTKLLNSDEIPIISMPSFDAKQMLDEDKFNEENTIKPLRFAKAFEVDIDIKKEGLEEKIDEGLGTIWRLKIKSSGAYSLNFIFGEYKLPDGAELFIYNNDKTQIIGALTEINNNDAKTVPVQPIKGDIAFIEYFEPLNALFQGSLKLRKIGHDYKGILNGQYDGRFRTSQSCNVDINCSEGDDWQNESHSVCRILINASGYCTGSLVNNVDSDGTAYVLTANHCISTASDANNTVFVFNYESPTCNGVDGSVVQSISNSTLRAHWSTSDFSLVELSSVPPANYNPYWNGWNNQNNTPSAPVVCIHHPAGDVKKISRDDSSPTTYNTNFWKVIDWTVGTVEHGSSGAPFYNSNHRVVGQVSGGNNIFCNPNEESWYGKFSSSWSGNGTNATRLQNWLDPANTTHELPGLRFIQNATINSNTPVSGDIVRFENVTVQGSSNIVVDINDRFEATGTFYVPVGSTLEISP